MKKLFFLLISISLVWSSHVIAQSKSNVLPIQSYPKNTLKLDVLPIFKKELAFEYERSFSKTQSHNFRIGLKHFDTPGYIAEGEIINTYTSIKEKHVDVILLIIPIADSETSYEDDRRPLISSDNLLPTISIPFLYNYRYYFINKASRIYCQGGFMAALNRFYVTTKDEVSTSVRYYEREDIVSWEILIGSYSYDEIEIIDYTETRTIELKNKFNYGFSTAFGINTIIAEHYSFDFQTEIGLNVNNFNAYSKHYTNTRLYGNFRLLVGFGL